MHAILCCVCVSFLFFLAKFESFFLKKKTTLLKKLQHFQENYKIHSIKISQKWSHDPIIASLFSHQQQAVCIAAAKQRESSQGQNSTWLPEWQLSRWVEGGKIKDSSPVKVFLFEFQSKRWGRCVQRIYLMVSWEIEGVRERKISL